MNSNKTPNEELLDLFMIGWKMMVNGIQTMSLGMMIGWFLEHDFPQLSKVLVDGSGISVFALMCLFLIFSIGLMIVGLAAPGARRVVRFAGRFNAPAIFGRFGKAWRAARVAWHVGN